MTNELVIIMTLRSYEALKLGAYYGNRLVGCDKVLLNRKHNAIALWWNSRPLSSTQVEQSEAIINKLTTLDCTDYLILRIRKDVEPESIGCFHDHPFTVKQHITFEVINAN